MELMILRMNNTKKEYYAGFNRHEWFAFDKSEDFFEFVNMVGISNRTIFDEFKDQNRYALAFIDLKTAKAVDKKFSFEGSFIRAFKERVAK